MPQNRDDLVPAAVLAFEAALFSKCRYGCLSLADALAAVLTETVRKFF